MPAASAARVRKSHQPPEIVRFAFVALLVMWIGMPFALHGLVAQDAVPFIAAGRLAETHPDDVYATRGGNLFELDQRFRDAWCDAAPQGTDCDNLAVAFVSSPPTVPVVVVLGRLPSPVGSLLMQLMASLLLAAGMWLIWQRLAHRTRNAAALVLVATLLLTPMAMSPIRLGQTSPVLFLSVCLGAGAAGSRLRRTAVGVWIAASLTKVFPGALVVLLIWRRRWRDLAVSAAVVAGLSLASLVWLPTRVWSEFVTTTRDLSSTVTTNPYNGSFSALVARLLPGAQAEGIGAVTVTVIAALTALAICWFGMRRVSDDVRWSVGYLALLFFTPLVWWHYCWIAIGAVAVVLSEQRRLNDRLIALLPATAAVSLIPSIPNARGWSLPTMQALFLMAATGTVLVLVARLRADAPDGRSTAREATADPTGT